MDIIEDVENTFNFVIEAGDVSLDVIFETMQPAVMSGDNYADLVGTTMWAFGKLPGGGLTADLTKIETLDLYAEGLIRSSVSCQPLEIQPMALAPHGTDKFGKVVGAVTHKVTASTVSL